MELLVVQRACLGGMIVSNVLPKVACYILNVLVIALFAGGIE